MLIYWCNVFVGLVLVAVMESFAVRRLRRLFFLNDIFKNKQRLWYDNNNKRDIL